jgi:hypothetical protein
MKVIGEVIGAETDRSQDGIERLRWFVGPTFLVEPSAGMRDESWLGRPDCALQCGHDGRGGRFRQRSGEGLAGGSFPDAFRE